MSINSNSKPPFRFPDKNCIDAIFIRRRRQKYDFALPVEMLRIAERHRSRAFQFQLKIKAFFNWNWNYHWPERGRAAIRGAPQAPKIWLQAIRLLSMQINPNLSCLSCLFCASILAPQFLALKPRRRPSRGQGGKQHKIVIIKYICLPVKLSAPKAAE
jgi:hypothetical protein